MASRIDKTADHIIQVGLRQSMLKVDYDFDIDGALHEDPFLDSYEINLMFEQTKQSMTHAMTRKLEGIICDEHGEAPVITIIGRYNAETEQFDITYNVNTCCKLFLMR